MTTNSIFKNALIGGGIGALANVIVFFVAQMSNVIGSHTKMPDGSDLGLIPVIVSSIIPAIVAGIVLLILQRFSKNPVGLFKIIGYIFLAVSMMGPFGTPNLDNNLRIVLAIMHVVSGVSIIYFMTKKAKA